MTTITITLTEERSAQLQQIADRLGVSPEELARVGVEELLLRPGEDFRRAVDHVLTKNDVLYQNLD